MVGACYSEAGNTDVKHPKEKQDASNCIQHATTE
jgi:hypothetical protein